MKSETLRNIADTLMGQLLTFSFPYREILTRQVNSSAKSIYNTADYFCVNFTPDRSTVALPRWLPDTPIVWQIITDDTPILGQLFLCDGYIERYEVIDFGFNEIVWSRVWEGDLQFEIEYNQANILGILTQKDIAIQKIVHVQHGVDIELFDGGRTILACFRECTGCPELNLQMPVTTHLQIQWNKTASAFDVSLHNTDLAFQCKAVYLQYNARWSTAE